MQINMGVEGRIITFNSEELLRIKELSRMCKENWEEEQQFALLSNPLSILIIRTLYELENYYAKDLFLIVPDEYEDDIRYIMTYGEIYFKLYNLLQHLKSFPVLPAYLNNLINSVNRYEPLQLEEFLYSSTTTATFNRRGFLGAKKVNPYHPFEIEYDFPIKGPKSIPSPIN